MYPWHVPVFFILAEYLWSGRRSLSQEARRRVETLGRPCAFWLVVLIATTIVVLGPDATGRIVGALRGGSVALQPFTTFWFVSDLLAAALLFAVLQHLPVWLRWALTALGVAFG